MWAVNTRVCKKISVKIKYHVKAQVDVLSRVDIEIMPRIHGEDPGDRLRVSLPTFLATRGNFEFAVVFLAGVLTV